MAKITPKISLPSIFLFLIIILASILRLYQLGQNPPALYSDEADIAFQADTFNRCRTDYFGNKFPTHFHSFADWQTPFYIYAVSFTQKIFGVSEFSTRLPSAFFGILTIPLFYLLIKQIYKNPYLALISTFVMAINPWHIHYSKTAFAVTMMLFFIISGLYFFFKFQQTQKSSHLLYTSLLFIFSIYSYSTAKLYILLILPVLFLFNYKNIFKLGFKKLLYISIISFLVLIPLILDTLNGKSGFRFSYISIFSDPTIPKNVDYQRFVDAVASFGQQVGLKTTLSSTFFHNKLNSLLTAFQNNYVQAFSTDFLFLKSDLNLRHGFGKFGYFYPVELVFLLIGLLSLFAKNLDKKNSSILLLLLILAPIPSALTNDSVTPHGTRLFLMLPFLIILISCGLLFLFSYSKKLFFPALLVISTIYISSSASFLHYYYIHYPQLSSRDWHVGLKQVVTKAVSMDYKHIYFSNSYEPFTPFFMLWNRQIFDSCRPPAKEFIQTNDGFFDGQNFYQKYYLGHLEWPNIKPQHLQDSLFVIPAADFLPAQTQIKSSLNYLDPQINIKDTISPDFIDSQEFIFFTVDVKTQN